MTVRELIQKLSAFDPDLRVLTPGFDESGLDDVTEVKQIEVVFNVKVGSHSGAHWDASETHMIENFAKKAVLEAPKPAVLIDW